MKLKDLNPQPGQVYSRTEQPGTIGVIHMRYEELSVAYYRIIEVDSLSNALKFSGFDSVDDCDYDDWQLSLQPAPVLGEEIKSNSFAPGQRLLTVINGKIFPAWLHTGDGVLNFLDNHGYFHRCTTPVYLDPRPLPSLPPEPSLDEQLEQIARGNPAQWPRQIIAQVKQIPQIAALIGGSDE